MTISQVKYNTQVKPLGLDYQPSLDILDNSRMQALGNALGQSKMETAKSDERSKKFEDVTTNILLPLIAAAEVIGTKGQSQGQTAIAAQQNLLARQQAEKEKQAKTEEARKKAEDPRERYAIAKAEKGLIDLAKSDSPEGGEFRKNLDAVMPHLKKIYGENDPFLAALNAVTSEDLGMKTLGVTLPGASYIGRDIERQKQIAPYRIGEKVATEQALRPEKVETAAQVAYQSTMQRALADTESMKTGQKQLSPAQSEAKRKAFTVMSGLEVLKSALDNGDVNFFDLTAAGDFSNPDVRMALLNAKQGVGREESGAAINPSEWVTFENMILNRRLLLTEQGRETARRNLNNMIKRVFTQGYDVTLDPEWYSSMKTVDIGNVFGEDAQKEPEYEFDPATQELKRIN